MDVLSKAQWLNHLKAGDKVLVVSSRDGRELGVREVSGRTQAQGIEVSGGLVFRASGLLLMKDGKAISPGDPLIGLTLAPVRRDSGG